MHMIFESIKSLPEICVDTDTDITSVVILGPVAPTLLKLPIS